LRTKKQDFWQLFAAQNFQAPQRLQEKFTAPTKAFLIAVRFIKLLLMLLIGATCASERSKAGASFELNTLRD
jgi:hypothetical protein